MKDIYLKIYVNDVDKTSFLKPFITDLDIETSFNTDLNPSKLNIKFDSGLYYTFNFTDRLKIELGWSDDPYKYVSEQYYFDLFTDSVYSGDQHFQISAIQHYPNFGTGGHTWNDAYTGNTTYATVMQKVLTTLGISDYLYPTLTSTYMTKKSSDSDANWTFRMANPFDCLKELNTTFGCVASVIENSKLRVYRIEDLNSLALSFKQNIDNSIISIGFSPSISSMAHNYATWYLSGSANFVDYLPVDTQFTSKVTETNTSSSNLWQNTTSANNASKGAYYIDRLKESNTKIEMMGNPYFKAGLKFELGSNFGRYAGVYFATQVVHQLSSGTWRTIVDAYPLSYRFDEPYESGIVFDATPSDRPVQDPPAIQPPGIDPPLSSLIVGKHLDRGGRFGASNARYIDITAARAKDFILNGEFGSDPVSAYSSADLDTILNKMYYLCNLNLIRFDHAVAIAMELTSWFRLRENTYNYTLMGYNPWAYTLIPNVTTLDKGTEAYIELLTHIATDRNFKKDSSGTSYGASNPYIHIYKTSWQQDFYQSIDYAPHINYRVYSDYVRDTLKRMYVYLGLAINVSIQP